MNYLIYGEEKYLIDQAIENIIKEKNINYDSVYKYDMEDTSIEELATSLNTYDLFSNNKLIVAQNSLFLTSKSNKEYKLDLLIEYLKNPNSSSILIISVNDKLDSRKKITKEINKMVTSINCNKLDDYKQREYIETMFKNKSYKINSQAINAFINRVNNDLYSINNETNKLMMYKADDKVITENDVNNAISKKIYDDVFMFVDSVINNDKKRMFEIYKDLVNYYNEEIIKLVNLIYNQFKLTYQVYILKKMNLTEDEISKKLAVHPYRVKLIYKNKNINEDKIIKYIYELCNLDLNIKSGKVNKESAFELFLLSI